MSSLSGAMSFLWETAGGRQVARLGGLAGEGTPEVAPLKGDLHPHQLLRLRSYLMGAVRNGTAQLYRIEPPWNNERAKRSSSAAAAPRAGMFRATSIAAIVCCGTGSAD